MKKRGLQKKALVLGMSAAMATGAMPLSAFAVTGSQVAKDGTYTAEVSVPDNAEDEWKGYKASLALTVKDGKFESVTVTPEKDLGESASYFNRAITANTSARKGIATVLTGQPATADTINAFDGVSGATFTSKAVKEAALAAIGQAEDAAAKAEEPAAVPEEKTEYVLMNIPYAEFYAAEVNNSIKVDAFSSATLNKPRTGSLSAGSYHAKADGSEITGVTYPVKVAEGVDLSKYTKVTEETSVDITVTNRGQTSTTTYQGKDALFENASYAYYVLKEAPKYYKEVTANADGTLSFGKVQGEVTKAAASATLSTNSRYGDYQMAFSGDLPFDADTVKVSGVVLETTDGASYGLRHMENIWLRTELAWSTGFTTDVHGCKTSSEHYASMMGKTISKVTYYTENGIYELDINDLYVPVKFNGSVKAADADVTAGEVALTAENLPSDFKAKYSVEGLEVNAKDGKLTFTSAKPGSYTLVTSDESGKYADLSSTFTLSTTELPAAYDKANQAVAAAEGVSKENLSDYLKNITSVNVNGTDYAASGRGSVAVINKETGAIDTSTKPFETITDSYKITVTATGYPELTFTATDLVQTTVMYRLYNPNSGEHFYTADAKEREDVIKAGWNDEGTGWIAPLTSKTPVYRVYNPNAGDHHYTTSKEEAEHLVSVGWKDEGIGWYSADETGEAVYRQYNPNAVAGAHNFTTSTEERDHLISVGWREEGIGWYGVKK